MRRLLLSGLILGLTGAVAPATQANASATVTAMAGKAYSGQHHSGNHHQWGHQGGGHWHGGSWFSYRPAFYYGYAWPTYWFKPAYLISNYNLYGLPAPIHGYGWYRYYDDAVLADSYGRIYDRRTGIRWSKYKHKHSKGDGAPPVPYDMGSPSDDRLSNPDDYEGRWVGTWYGKDGRTYSGEYQGSYRRGTPLPPPPDAPYAAPLSPPSAEGVPPHPHSYTSVDPHTGMVTTVTVIPPVTKTYVEEEVIYSTPAPRGHKTKTKLRVR